jgi:hypothetical protein
VSSAPGIVRRVLPGKDPFEIYDNGRRGLPIPGCDCEACFGRCLVNPDIRCRESLRRADERGRASTEDGATLL